MAYQTQNLEMAVGLLMPDMMANAGLTDDDPVFKAFPIGYVDADMVQWDMRENTGGLIPLRGLDAAPDLVTFNGYRRQSATPAYFGMETQIRESELVKAVQPGTLADPMNTGDRMTMLAQDAAGLVVPRIRKTCLDLIINGKVDIQDSKGRRFQYQLDGYSSQILVPSVPWFSSAGTATPIQNFLTWQAQLQTGTDSMFGEDSIVLANSATIAELFATAQIISTYRDNYGASIVGLKKLNDAIQGGFGLPAIVRYDRGYYPTPADAKARTNFTKHIPNRTLVWIGTRPDGDRIAQFQLTRNAAEAAKADLARYPDAGFDDGGNLDGLGRGLHVRCHLHDRMPVHYDFEIGFNGLPVVYRPSAFAAITYT